MRAPSGFMYKPFGDADLPSNLAPENDVMDLWFKDDPGGQLAGWKKLAECAHAVLMDLLREGSQEGGTLLPPKFNAKQMLEKWYGKPIAPGFPFTLQVWQSQQSRLVFRLCKLVSSVPVAHH